CFDFTGYYFADAAFRVGSHPTSAIEFTSGVHKLNRPTS
ncbi:hypothetical protein Tco_1024807, partial [Tanacetum coccineum]